jgi:hypothetical protein
VGNGLLLAEEKLAANTRLVPTRNNIELVDASAPLEAWELFDTSANIARRCSHFIGYCSAQERWVGGRSGVQRGYAGFGLGARTRPPR